MSGTNSDISTNSRSRIFLINLEGKAADVTPIAVCREVEPVAWGVMMVDGARGECRLVMPPEKRGGREDCVDELRGMAELVNVGMLTNEEAGMPRGRPGEKKCG